MFETVIGLEVHVQLNTKTKLFCACPTSFAEHQNTNTCPTCLALPGALPVVNQEAAIKAMRFGYAINADVNHTSIFDRKSYFYPDSPSAYQITQLTKAIVQNGELFIDLADGTQKRIGMTQAHLEADAGKNIHEADYSKVDLNRAGTPLLEIVSQPDMRSSDEAVAYLKKLHATVRYLDISDANMQEGSFRCDVNVSIRPKGQEAFGTRVEIKNINSFKFVAAAIAYEVQRQTEAYEDGVYEQEVRQETRLYNVEEGVTKSMRGKEEAADYRYFPDPDLRPLVVTEEMIAQAKKMPELPDAKVKRYVEELGVKLADAHVITSDKEMATYFEAMLACGAAPKTAVTWLTSELLGRLNKAGFSIETTPVDAKTLGTLVSKISDGTISGSGAKEILDFMMENESRDIDALIEKMGLAQVSDDGAILAIIDTILAANPEKVEQYKSGKDKLFGFFVGETMKASKGSANPAKVNELLKQRLG
ncbi:MAG TPA: Asp-tRNA(Asn)/Glu-tRNA(Gln) amidotransferase subunit GatB [Sulfurovum sp.]|jgi:aspartyl-tRNA(Asn)/glutamyl-tRNA(Gln) amidotransferase subunit B|nr:MAG: glutaminyl-tRNA synthase (glutamine-hydrolyzing) subunit B [Sulfurovum sp. 35-42-20]OYZ24771.1 MAG: glutaminyl-tRNA synthase (glutamine-hydrolyzing) subunit B [Sulfurovum sp. 16-42-52]OYZ49497.1 MAG: glutaminyl-tRNA synthase (glutamine-hydrolyzing) subunit B [Sulfurovum sp. 24-42-9]OZA59636.1 MAG: glutaminyl-tRNA synthase (glutamine-hydrolyzing) subunit B [Sulfurovum sp. 39-42-12]HQR73696.1 Asp-tRNA(Asn)/Glu-tRNA(Gln) amidotransferase subunit GatB [Sulfurovum sp.]